MYTCYSVYYVRYRIVNDLEATVVVQSVAYNEHGCFGYRYWYQPTLGM